MRPGNKKQNNKKKLSTVLKFKNVHNFKYLLLYSAYEKASEDG